ncbi:MAG: hypothetical protein WC769_05015 [Thermodesulfovibrionales bacterium]|jgi:hypothetical protein
MNDILTPEEAVKNEAHCICFAMDDDMINSLQRLKEILGFPIGAIISEALRPFVDTFLPVADSYEQGKLSADCVPEFMKGLESFITRADISKARLDKKVKILGKQQKVKGGVSCERKSKSPG